MKRTCDCSGVPVEVGDDNESRFAHNTTTAHRLAVLRQCGAPAEVIAAATPGTPEYEAMMTHVATELAKGGLL